MAVPRSLLRATTTLALAVGLSWSAIPAAAADLGPSILPTFAWPQFQPSAPAPDELSRWEGSYARMSTGFEVVSSRHFGSYGGPTVGFEGGRMWRDGALVYGIVGGFNYLTPFGGYGTPRFGSTLYTRDFAGALQVKVGALVTDDVLVYAKAGGAVVNERLRFGATSVSAPFSRGDIALRPDARIGVEWAVTDRLTVGIEAGTTGSRIR